MPEEKPSLDSQPVDRYVDKYPALRSSVAFSRMMLKQLRDGLAAELDPRDARSPCIAVCGSVGRLEASAASDLDYMIVYPDAPPADASTFRARAVTALRGISVGSREDGLYPFADPNPRGVFPGDVNGCDLVRKIGSREEDYNNISRRLLLLLEAQVLWNNDYFDSLRLALVNHYAADVARDPSKQFVLLINDLIRYFRTICVNYHHVIADEHGKWPIRNIKLRHSRVLMYASLLFSLGELSKFEYSRPNGAERSKVDWLLYYVSLTPIDRFVDLYTRNRDDNLFRFLSLYNNFLAAMADIDKRDELANLDHSRRYESPLFSQLKANSDAFASEVFRFLDARRGTWSDRFYEYLIL